MCMGRVASSIITSIVGGMTTPLQKDASVMMRRYGPGVRVCVACYACV